MSNKLNFNQLNVLLFIYLYTRRNGLPPTLTEIGAHFGIPFYAVSKRCYRLYVKGYLIDTGTTQCRYRINLEKLLEWAHS